METLDTRILAFAQADDVLNNLATNDAVTNAARFGLGAALMATADFIKDGHAVGATPTSHGRSLQVWPAIRRRWSQTP